VAGQRVNVFSGPIEGEDVIAGAMVENEFCRTAWSPAGPAFIRRRFRLASGSSRATERPAAVRDDRGEG